MRKAYSHEWPLISRLFRNAGLEVDPSELEVVPMDDGGMGSLRLNQARSTNKFGRDVAEVLFVDSDGVPVLATLNLDTAGIPFEVDVWKVDFSPLRKWPIDSEISDRPAPNNAMEQPRAGGS